MPEENAPSSAAFLPASLMYFCSGKPMHFHSGIDTIRRRGMAEPGHGKAKELDDVIG
jgi:hypothetical protein